jgi:hypothetical protein
MELSPRNIRRATVCLIDPDRRREFHREYKQRWRQKQGQSTGHFKAYICPHNPFLRVGPGLSFENGFLVTNNREAQIMIEGHSAFGRHIFKIALDSSAMPVDMEAD